MTEDQVDMRARWLYHRLCEQAAGVERTLWTAKKLQSRRGMDGRQQVQTVEEAILISSLTTSGKHAPCFDLDFRCNVVDDLTDYVGDEPGPVMELRLDEASELGFRAFAATFERLGLGKAELFRPPYDGEDWPPPDVVTLRFSVPARAMPSSSAAHAHLFIDHELAWDDYAELIDTAADANLLEEGFADNSLERQMTMLIRPGLTKTDLGGLGIEIDDYDDDGGDDEVADDDETRAGSPDGAVEAGRDNNDSAANQTETDEESMETTEQSNDTQTALPPGAETMAIATTKPNGLKIKEGETLVRRYSGQYPVPLSLDDRKKYSDSLAELNVRVAALEEKKKQATSQLATELKKVKLDINRLASALHNNKELREIDVYDVLDRSGGVVETRRLLDGETVGVRAAEHDDRQANLPGTIPGLEESVDDEDDDDAIEQRNEDDAEPHELDAGPHNGQTVTASGGGMPDEEDERDDGGDLDDDDDDDDQAVENDATVRTPPGSAPQLDDDDFDGNPGPSDDDDDDEVGSLDDDEDGNDDQEPTSDDPSEVTYHDDHDDDQPAAAAKKPAKKKPAAAPKKKATPKKGGKKR